MTAEPFRPSARNPRGFQDKRANSLAVERCILERVTRVYEAWGFEALETASLDYADALGKFLPDDDRPNVGVFAMQDDDEQWLALRYDLTAPLARFAAQNWETLPKPFRRYAYGPVWRNEKPGPGRFREFIQCDADTVGSARPEADAEMIAMAAEGFAAVGVPGGARIKINNRKLLDGLLTDAAVTDQAQKLAVLRAVDKLDRLGIEGVQHLLGAGRMDESGAFTKGAQLSISAIDAVLGYLTLTETPSRSMFITQLSASLAKAGQVALEEMSRIDVALTALGIDSNQAWFDVSVVRGLEYYTGTVFEAELATLPGGVNIGSVGGGGRYDDLVARFTGTLTPATGFSFGVSRLATALLAIGETISTPPRGPVVIIAFESGDMAHYFAAAAELRSAGVPAEVYLGSAGMKAQMKYADRRSSPAVVMLGGDEIAAGSVTIKDLDIGRALSTDLADNSAWREGRPGQMTIPRVDMVSTLKRIVDQSR